MLHVWNIFRVHLRVIYKVNVLDMEHSSVFGTLGPWWIQHVSTCFNGRIFIHRPSSGATRAYRRDSPRHTSGQPGRSPRSASWGTLETSSSANLWGSLQGWHRLKVRRVDVKHHRGDRNCEHDSTKTMPEANHGAGILTYIYPILMTQFCRQIYPHHGAAGYLRLRNAKNY